LGKALTVDCVIIHWKKTEASFNMGPYILVTPNLEDRYKGTRLHEDMKKFSWEIDETLF
jgi:hypothetical protein